MKTIIGITVLVMATASVLSGCSGGEEGAVRRVVGDVRAAALDGLNLRNADALDEYFATLEEGAQAAGLAETQQAYKDFVAGLSTGDAVQFHSFDITAVEVHEDAKLAKVTYRLHFSVVRSSVAVFGAKAAQNLALLKTPRGWRISGGDTPQLEDVMGTWPTR